MKKKTGAQEHTIIISTILGSILVFVLGFFLGRAWVLMPQEKMTKVKKTTPVVSEQKEEEFEDTLSQLREQKRMIEELEKQETQKIEEGKRKKESELRLAQLREKKKQEQQEKELAKKGEKEKLLADQKEKERLAKLAQEKELAMKEEEEQKRRLQKELKRKQEVEKKALEAKQKAIKEQKPQPPVEEKETPSSPSQEEFTIQLQSSQNRERVEELLTELRNRGYLAYAIQVDLKEKGIWYRIRLGKYNSREEALNEAEKLKNKGVISNYLITKR
ncbi:MAG: SPOR domain-containing protein [bacterium]